MMWILPKPIISAFAPDTEALILDSSRWCQLAAPVAYVEIEAFAIANLVAKMEAGELDQAPIWTDVKTFPAEKFHGLVDIVSGGYPCQPFSAAGKRLGTDDPRHLWPFLRGAVRAIRPSRVFLENVEGHISLGLSTVLSDLDEDGYDATWGIFSAAECGAPTRESESSSWPTPDASVEKFRLGGNSQQSRSLEAMGRRGELSQPDLVNRNSTGKNPGQWPTPKAAAPSSTRKPGTGGKELAEEAKKNWPTPRASGQNDSARKLNKSGKRHAGDDLTTAAKNWATPEAQNHVGCQTRHGKTFPSLGTQTGGKLNPNWVEQLMGVPVGWTQLPTEWTDCASSETALSRQQQQKRGSN
jgi:site-specific DNA-cytosine methylase